MHIIQCYECFGLLRTRLGDGELRDLWRSVDGLFSVCVLFSGEIDTRCAMLQHRILPDRQSKWANKSHRGYLNKTLLAGQSLQRNPAATTPLQPLIWCSEGPSSNVSESLGNWPRGRVGAWARGRVGASLLRPARRGGALRRCAVLPLPGRKRLRVKRNDIERRWGERCMHRCLIISIHSP